LRSRRGAKEERKKETFRENLSVVIGWRRAPFLAGPTKQSRVKDGNWIQTVRGKGLEYDFPVLQPAGTVLHQKLMRR
jgi:hypothetical protein